ncbi:HAD hydrolase-like protein [Sinorhizobium americanum]|uniref:HAD-hyrolase-like protein n=1 Tax=Sinorhizobium americanum TaxID=194963 RepID=A0A4V2RBB9_9HYPH|nr:HAD hydrolase-like protein [Sinorhizobium americanum]TCN16440.1 HAD-hyrolase-like protein [Sinorhizobium americanum]
MLVEGAAEICERLAGVGEVRIITNGIEAVQAKRLEIIVGDRLEADILGANQFGIESCWFNPLRAENWSSAVPTIQVARLSEIAVRLAGG